MLVRHLTTTSTIFGIINPPEIAPFMWFLLTVLFDGNYQPCGLAALRLLTTGEPGGCHWRGYLNSVVWLALATSLRMRLNSTMLSLSDIPTVI
jgi:hypothetical protein